MITRLIVLLSLLLWPAVAHAQLRPGAFNTVRTTDTTDNSLNVGCAVGAATTTCAGGINARITTLYLDEVDTDEGRAAFHIRGATNNNKIVVVGYNTTGNYGFIQSNQLGTGFTPLTLQPNGGNINFGPVALLSCTNCVTAGDLATTTVSAGAYGSATAIGTFTVDAQGRLTAAANVTPQLTLTSTYFSSLSGTAITGIPQFVAATNTFTGALIWSTTAVFSWNSKSTGTTYQAASDGFVLATADCSGGGGCAAHVNLITDSSGTPTTQRTTAWAVDGVASSAMMPVKKNDFYKVTAVTGAGAPSFVMWWVPMGTGG